MADLSKATPSGRSVIFLYTDAAEIDARTKKAMAAAGFLPVKVASLDAVRFMEPAVRIEGDLPVLLKTACQVIAENPQSVVAKEWGLYLARTLLEIDHAALAKADANG